MNTTMKKEVQVAEDTVLDVPTLQRLARIAEHIGYGIHYECKYGFAASGTLAAVTADTKMYADQPQPIKVTIEKEDRTLYPARLCHGCVLTVPIGDQTVTL